MFKGARLTFDSSIRNLTDINSSFDSGILRIAYTGKNRNGTYISKETFERAIPTMYCVPVVGHFVRDEGDFGGHDIGVVKNSTGGLSLVNYTTPLGFVPESAAYYWEEINGHEYLSVDVIIWKRQEGYQKLKDDGIASESMEITIKDGHNDKDMDVFVIDDFEFTAFCLLGESVEPCFEEASLELYSLSEFREQFQLMMSEAKETLYLVNKPEGDDNIENYMEGGTTTLNEKIELAAEYGIDVEGLDFSLDDFSIEELKEKFEAIKASEQSSGSEADPETDPETFALNTELSEELHHALSQEKKITDWGESARYWMVDFDVDASEVYAWDTTDWLLYGFTYSMNGDAAVIDFDSKKRKKYAIVDFEGETIPETDVLADAIFSEFASVSEKIEATEGLQSKYQEISGQVEAMETELNVLREYRATMERSVINAAREEVFSKFENLTGVEAFEELKANCDDLNIEDLEEKCYAIQGRQFMAKNFSLNTSNQRNNIIIDKSTERLPYNGVVEKYLGIKGN